LKTELEIQEIEAIADKVIEKLKPLLNNGRHDAEDTILEVQGLSECLKVSKQWIYERTHLKEIPHLKIDGQLRFRKRDIDKWLNSYNVPAISTPKRIMKATKRKEATSV
jgi:excisionase family DNA binding protein